MIDQEKLIKILEREFREKRIYGDSEDFKLFKQEKDENNQNCNILINEYYSHGGFPYQNNKEAEEDLSNYTELSIESVQDALKQFSLLKITRNAWFDQPLFRIDLTKPPTLSNVIPLNFSQYFQEIYPRKREILKKNPNYSKGIKLESLAIKRNELAIKMQRNPSLRDPNSHLMKEFREIYSKMAEIENFLIKDHIEINLGEIKHVLHVDDDEILPFWLYQIPKLKNKDFGAIVTSGFSMMPLNVPSELNFIFSYLEFLVTIPSDFPLPMKNEKKYEFCWFIEKLKFFISYIHRDRTYFTHSHTYGNGNPPKPFIKSSGICGFLFQYPVEEIPPNFWEFGIPPIKNIHFIQLIPMYENELYYVLDNSDEKLMKLFKDRKIPRYLDMKRKNSLSEKGYNNSNYGKSSTFCKKCGTVIKNIDPTQKKIECPQCNNKIKLKK